jgi:hypothetical protein
MAYMQTRATGVGKHIQHIIFGAGRLITYLINSGRPPVGLPFFFNRSKIVFHNISFNSQGLFNYKRHPSATRQNPSLQFLGIPVVNTNIFLTPCPQSIP